MPYLLVLLAEMVGMMTDLTMRRYWRRLTRRTFWPFTRKH